MKELPRLFEKKEDCCGCTACAAVCPTGAITMQADDEGFFYPVLDREKCIGCQRCAQVCKEKNPPKAAQPQVYAARAKDPEVLEKSTSGGMFVPVSDYILENGGAVACCIYDYETNNLEFRLVTDKKTRDLAVGSKYLQSRLGDSFRQCLQWLQSNPEKKLLFVGMGCQADGFRRFMQAKGLTERVYIVDIVCHGMPSHRIWKDYVQLLEKKQKGKLEQVSFRDKRKGWSKPTAVARIGGQEVSIQSYSHIFYSRNAMKPACYVCPYARVTRSSDWTIGDYWGIEKALPEFYQEKGNSLVLVHTPKGAALFAQVSARLDYCQTTVEACLQPNLVAPTKRPAERERFWKDYRRGGIRLLVAKYGKGSYFFRGIGKIRRLLKLQGE